MEQSKSPLNAGQQKEAGFTSYFRYLFTLSSREEMAGEARCHYHVLSFLCSSAVKKTVIIWGLKEFLIRRNYIPVSIAASTTRNARTSAFPVLGRQWAVQRNWRPLLSYFRPYEQSRHNGNVLLIGRYTLQLLLGMCHRKHSEFSRCELYEAIDCWLGVQLRSFSFVFDCETTAARKVSW